MTVIADGAPASRRWRGELAAIALALLGVLARCAPWREVFTAQGIVPLDVDSYYHLRRALLIVEQFPSRVLFDAFISFPWGSSINWPPGFDLLLALPGLLGLGTPAVLAWSALLPPLLGGGGVYLVYRLGRAVDGEAAGLLAALFVALMHAATDSGVIGRADHHVLVTPVMSGLFLASLRSLHASTARAAWSWAVLTAALAGLSVAGWVITPPLYFVPLPLTLLLLRDARWRTPASAAARRVLGLSAVAVGLVVLAIADLERKPVDLYQPSAFIVLPYAVAWAVVAASHRGRRALVVTAVSLLVLGAVAVLLSTTLQALLGEALATALAQDPTYTMMLESRSPLFREDWFDVRGLATAYTSLVFALPALLAWVGLRAWREPERRPGLLLVTCLGALATALLLLQERFGEYAAPAIALLYGLALSQGGRLLRRAIVDSPRPWRTRGLAVGLGLCLLWALAPLLQSPLANLRASYSAPQQALLRFARQVQPLLAPAAVDGRPAHGVLTSWSDAHPWLFATGHAVMVTPFGTVEGEAANRQGFRLWLAVDGEAVLRALDAHRLRYLLCSSIVGQTKPMAIIAGLPPLYEEVRWSAQGHPVFAVSELFFATLHARLLFEDGAPHRLGETVLPALDGLRLLAESDAEVEVFGRRHAGHKLFERVPGARLVGLAAPGQRVRTELTLQTAQGRVFVDVREVQAASHGDFELRLPYPSGHARAQVQAVGDYRVQVGDRRCTAQVDDDDVRLGREVGLQRCGELPAVAGASGPASRPR
jgi:dolichyl-diphosphooligosaccharide--protein glycosyltransferase